jgi:rod shape determining protein RodA
MNRLRNFDWILQTAVVLLLVLSVAVIFGTTFEKSGGPSNAIQQTAFALTGFGLVAVFGMTDYRVFRRVAGTLYLTMLGSLFLVKIIGSTALGATRWINFGFFQFQPSEFAKIVMVIVLAKVFADNQKNLDAPRTMLISLAYTIVPVLLVASQPDLGTAMVIAATWLGMAIATGIPKRFFLYLFGASAAVFPLLWVGVLHSYQKNRIMTFIDPARDPLGAGYNVKQATIAVGSGGLWGRALGQGTQSQLNFLPVQHTDFIFAVLAEQLGFAGSILVVTLLATVVIRALSIAKKARDFFGYQLAIGITTIILFQTLINIGMNTGIMPVTGIPLPLVSYGGSSVLMLLFAVGILQSITSRREARMLVASRESLVVG